MRLTCLAVVVLAASCSPTRAALRPDASAFAVRDCLTTAYEALALSETDADGHRVRAQLETREALRALDELGRLARTVPYDGPPSLAVALELLELSLPKMASNARAQAHAQRAVEELRAVVR